MDTYTVRAEVVARVNPNVWVKYLVKDLATQTAAQEMFAKMGMRNTRFVAEKPAVSGYSVPSVITDGIDYNKFKFTIGNGGKYAGKQVFSPQVAKLLLENL